MHGTEVAEEPQSPEHSAVDRLRAVVLAESDAAADEVQLASARIPSPAAHARPYGHAPHRPIGPPGPPPAPVAVALAAQRRPYRLIYFMIAVYLFASALIAAASIPVFKGDAVVSDYCRPLIFTRDWQPEHNGVCIWYRQHYGHYSQNKPNTEPQLQAPANNCTALRRWYGPVCSILYNDGGASGRDSCECHQTNWFQVQYVWAGFFMVCVPAAAVLVLPAFWPGFVFLSAVGHLLFMGLGGWMLTDRPAIMQLTDYTPRWMWLLCGSLSLCLLLGAIIVAVLADVYGWQLVRDENPCQCRKVCNWSAI